MIYRHPRVSQRREEFAYRNLKTTNPQAAEFLLSFASSEEKKCAPVQAADAVVYEVRRTLNLLNPANLAT
jgi:hypothetical protein